MGRVGSGDETIVKDARGDRASSDLVSADVRCPCPWLLCCTLSEIYRSQDEWKAGV